MTDYERGVEQASAIYKEVIREYVAENAKLRELAGRMLSSIRRFEACSDSYSVSSVYEQWMRELGVDE